MKSIAAILVFLSAGAFAVAPRVLGNKQECAIWGMAFLTIMLVGFIWAKRYRAFLPEGERQRLRMSGYIDGVTSGMGPGKTKLFCMALGVWLFCLGLRLIWHVYG